MDLFIFILHLGFFLVFYFRAWQHVPHSKSILWKISPWKNEMHTGLGCHFHSWWTVCVWRACRTSPSCRISYSIWCFRGKKLWGCGHVVGGSTSNSTIWLSLPSFFIVQIEMFGFAGLTRKNKENTFNQWWPRPTKVFFFYLTSEFKCILIRV